jgi:hypothetical protein
MYTRGEWRYRSEVRDGASERDLNGWAKDCDLSRRGDSIFHVF